MLPMPEPAGDRDELLVSEERFRLAYQEAAVGMVMLDLDGKILEVNKALCEISGYIAEHLIGQPMTVLLAREHEVEVARILSELVSGEQHSYRAERRLVRQDGESIWVRNSASVLRYSGKPARLFVLVEDITEGKHAIEKLQYQAAHEEVTGLYNRRYFEELLTRALEPSEGGAAAVLILDLDGFKLVNDTLGHKVGDELLREVGIALAQCVEPRDILARLGGDEFAIVRPGGTPDDAAALATRLLSVFQKSFTVAGSDLHIGASIGAVSAPADGSTAGELLQNADAAMYSAKRNGRNRYATFTSALRSHAAERLQAESQIRQALASGEFHAEFQPIFDAKERRLTRFEAVCRWNNPLLGEVSPSVFIPLAEEIGVIASLGRFMMRTACEAANAWNRKGTPAGVSVNVSTLEFARPDFVDSVWQIVEETNIDPGLLELELNETILMGDSEASIGKLTRLRDLGARVTLDDFGTSYSSLSHLRRIPVSALKIDRTFVADLQSGPSAVSLVRSIIGIASSFNLRVLADGVETDAQFRVLRFLGCNEVQGFLFGKPEPFEEASQRLRDEQSRYKAAQWGSSRPGPGPGLQRRYA